MSRTTHTVADELSSVLGARSEVVNRLLENMSTAFSGRAVKAPVIGRVRDAAGVLVTATGLSVKVGEVCELLHSRDSSGGQALAECVAFRDDAALLSPLSGIDGLKPGDLVTGTGRELQVPVGNELLGRVIDAFGKPIDGGGSLWHLPRRSMRASPPAPMHRKPITLPLPTGVRAIDSLLTVAIGQRIGVLAPAGTGKSTLLGAIARNAVAEIVVIALIGERGREVKEFIDKNLGPDGLKRAVVICATADECASARSKAMSAATTIAEAFRDDGRNVLLLVDSVTRYARALREIGLGCGEPPTRRGFPPSVFSTLPTLFERAGTSNRGSITGIYTVLEESADASDPISEEVRSLLDGHIALSRKLASQGHYPAINVLDSVSRLMTQVVSPSQVEQASKLRELVSKREELELLIQVGEYKPGNDALSDLAASMHEAIKNFLRQDVQECSSFNETLNGLRSLT
jgi:ATP synthase in type III secretion protein N